jgi:hypothetical protein
LALALLNSVPKNLSLSEILDKKQQNGHYNSLKALIPIKEKEFYNQEKINKLL